MRTRILPPTPENLETAAQALRAGELVAIPTETVYGLAGDGLNEKALAGIFQAKERPTFDPLILHLPLEWRYDFLERGLVDVKRLGASAARRVQSLTEALWPGPLTLVLPKLRVVPDLATSGLDTAAFRIPAHPVAQEILRRADRPLAAPSANRFGRISPTEAAHVMSELQGRIPWIVDGGPCAIGVESTVLRVIDDSTAVLLRPGKIGADEIESVSGLQVLTPREFEAQGSEETEGRPMHAPGMLASHYAPSKRLVLLDRHASEFVDRILSGPAPGILFFNTHSAEDFRAAATRSGSRAEAVSRVLSPEGDLETAARNLFRLLRELDESDAQLLYAEPPPAESGLGHAIIDRLTRASAK